MNSTPKLPPTPTVEELSNLAKSDFDQWLKLMVTGGARLPFGSSSSYEAHPLRGYFEKNTSIINSNKFVYTELMMLHAERLGYVEREAGDSEMISVKDRIVDVLFVDLNRYQVKEWRTADSIPNYMWLFIKDAMSNLSSAVNELASDLLAGVPLYRLGSTRAQDVRVEDWEQPSAFLIGKASYHDTSVAPSCLPVWAAGHGFRRSDLSARPLFFRGAIEELLPEQFAALRAAYRTHIGYATPKRAEEPAKSSHGSKLMLALQEVQTRYYGPNFSLSDQQTWPKQKDVVEWLKTSRGLSEREASSVDIVARPDALRGKP